MQLGGRTTVTPCALRAASPSTPSISRWGGNGSHWSCCPTCSSGLILCFPATHSYSLVGMEGPASEGEGHKWLHKCSLYRGTGHEVNRQPEEGWAFFHCYTSESLLEAWCLVSWKHRRCVNACLIQRGSLWLDMQIVLEDENLEFFGFLWAV